MQEIPDSICVLIRELAAADDNGMPGARGELIHQMHAIAVQLACECNGKSVSLSQASRWLVAPSQHAADTLQRGHPEIKSPQILEWDYEGESIARRLDQERSARVPAAVGA